MNGGSYKKIMRRAKLESLETALIDNIKRELQNKMFLNNEGENVLFKDLSKYEQNTIIDDKIFEKEKEESKKELAKKELAKALKSIEELEKKEQAARAAQAQEAQQRELRRKIIEELKKSTYTNNLGVKVEWKKLKPKLKRQIIENKMIEIAMRESKKGAPKKEAQPIRPAPQPRRPPPPTEEPPQPRLPVQDGKRRKLPELKSIKFNYIPPDGLCGYRAIYNASEDIKIEKDKNIQPTVIHKIRENLDPNFLIFLEYVILILNDTEAKAKITSNSDEIKKSRRLDERI